MALLYIITIATVFTSVLCLQGTESNTFTGTTQAEVADKVKMLQDLAKTDILHDCYLIYFDGMNSEEDEPQENSEENPAEEDTTNLLGAGSSKFLKCTRDAYRHHFMKMESRRKPSLYGNNVLPAKKPSQSYNNVLPLKKPSLSYGSSALSAIFPTSNSLLDYLVSKPNIQLTYPGHQLEFGRKEQDTGL